MALPLLEETGEVRGVRIAKQEGDFLHRSRRIEEQPCSLFEYRILDHFARRTAGNALTCNVEGIGCCRKTHRDGFDRARLRFAIVGKSDGANHPVDELSIPTE